MGVVLTRRQKSKSPAGCYNLDGKRVWRRDDALTSFAFDKNPRSAGEKMNAQHERFQRYRLGHFESVAYEK